MMDRHGFVPEPNCGRGSISIIWSCATTIILSIWTSSHRDVDPDGWLPGRILDSLMCVLLPETIVVVVAHRQYMEARQMMRSMRRIPGFEAWSIKQSFLVLIKGAYIDRQWVEESGWVETNRLWQATYGTSPIMSPQLAIRLAKKGLITMEDVPSDKDINRRSKSDWFSKLIAIFQATWFGANMLSRLVLHYDISLFEDITIAYAVCGLSMFILWFRCPQDIEEPFEVKPRAPGDKRAFTGRSAKPPLSMTTYLSLIILFVGIFVGIHLAAWNYPFLTPLEAWLWRAGSLGMLPLVLILVALGDSNTCATVLVLLAYSICRLAILGVALAGFRNSPASVYNKPSWSQYWAHLGS